MNNAKILYIDDEEHNLQAFRATFRRKYEVHTAISAEAAENVLEQHSDIRVIVSDQRMPGVTGVEFFKSIKTTYPDAIRILLTGYTDIEALSDAINEGDIYRYVTKPWNELELNNCIINSLDRYNNRAELKQKVNELQKTNEELNRVIYSISHELRAPLASAMGIIQLARMENIIDANSRADEYWKMLEECCNILDYNITNTLQYYKTRKYQIVQEKINFEELCSHIIALHKTAHNAHDVLITQAVSQHSDFYGDSFRIETILGNLVSNAIKYQDPQKKDKRIDVKIGVNEKEAILGVSDNGIGISEQNREKIFQQFFRGNFEKGSGLGLFIVKEALDKINGKVVVHSEPDIGSNFTVTVPNNSPL